MVLECSIASHVHPMHEKIECQCMATTRISAPFGARKLIVAAQHVCLYKRRNDDQYHIKYTHTNVFKLLYSINMHCRLILLAIVSNLFFFLSNNFIRYFFLCDACVWRWSFFGAFNIWLFVH